MKEAQPSARSLAQQRVQARRLRRRALFEAGAVVILSLGLGVLIHEGLHIALKIICGLMIVSAAANGVGDFFGYKERLKKISEMEVRE